MIKNIAVLGLGKVGSLVATLLNTKYEVVGVDANTSRRFSFEFHKADVSDKIYSQLIKRQASSHFVFALF